MTFPTVPPTHWIVRFFFLPYPKKTHLFVTKWNSSTENLIKTCLSPRKDFVMLWSSIWRIMLQHVGLFTGVIDRNTNAIKSMYDFRDQITDGVHVVWQSICYFHMPLQKPWIFFQTRYDIGWILHGFAVNMACALGSVKPRNTHQYRYYLFEFHGDCRLIWIMILIHCSPCPWFSFMVTKHEDPQASRNLKSFSFALQ